MLKPSTTALFIFLLSSVLCVPVVAQRTDQDAPQDVQFDRPLELGGSTDPFGGFGDPSISLDVPDASFDLSFGDPFGTDPSLTLPVSADNPTLMGRAVPTATAGATPGKQNQTPVPINYSEVRNLMKCPVTGSVVLNILVDRIGRYVRHEVEDANKAPQPLLASVEAHVSKLKFKPARIGDLPVDAWVSLPFEFKQ